MKGIYNNEIYSMLIDWQDSFNSRGDSILLVAKVNEKGQITLPVQIRERFGIAPGNMILVLADTEKGIALVNIAAAEEGGTIMEAPAMYGEE